MIARGTFQSVSMAIYGDVVSEMPPPSLTYEPKAIPSFDPIPLSNALDPSNFRDPTRLALQLLELIPDAPPLSLIIRLMFCLKPSNDDWDLPEFPYLYADLDEDFSDLEKAFRLTSRPVADTTSHASFARFSEAVARSLGPKVSTGPSRMFLSHVTAVCRTTISAIILRVCYVMLLAKILTWQHLSW